jgi:hypothetical protein
MTKIVSFGDSFVFGSELAHNEDGSQSWIAQASRNLGATYETYAKPGCGNDYIARQIYSYFSAKSADATLAVINWTWISRWDFYIVEHETWITLGPTCVPERLKDLVSQTEAEDLIEFYRDRANSSLLWNKFRNLQTIWAAQQYLDQKGIKSVQTYMDYELFDDTCHAPDYIKELQKLVFSPLQLFDEENFVDWSHTHGYPVTIEGMHPLEQAHTAAAKYWEDVYKI